MKRFTFLIIIGLSAINLIGQNSISSLSEDEKVFGLSQIWKEADKNFVFFDQIPEVNWDSTYLKFIPVVKSTKTDYLYFKELQRFCSILNDGHTRVHVPWNFRKIHEASLALRTELINDKIVIVEILNDTIANQGVKIGMEIVKINGQDAKEYASENIEPFVFYSTPQDKNVQVYEHNLLKGHIDSLLSITTILNETKKEFKLSRKLRSVVREKPTFAYSLLENNIGHLKIFRFWGDDFDSEFDSIYQQVKKSDKLIIDVSDNSGGNSGFADYVLKHFVNESYQTSNWKTPKYMPAYASWGNDLEWEVVEGYKVKPIKKSKRYKGTIVVTISEKTYSAGEDFVSAFINTNRGKVLGRATAGTTGNPIGFGLLGVSGFQICSKRDYLANGQEFVGYGIMPQIEVPKSMNEKLLIEKAIHFLKLEK